MSLTVEKVMESMLHVGSLKKESSPKTSKCRTDIVNGIVVIDPVSIVKKLDATKKRVQQSKKEKKQILVVCDKSMYADELRALAEKHDFHYLNEKIPPGFLTNFDTLMVRIKDLNKKLLFIDSEDFLKLTKKEQVATKRSVKKIEKVYGGVRNLKERPDLTIVVDGAMMVNFLKEVRKIKADNVVLCSTDFNVRRSEKDSVVANMKSYKSMDLMLQYIFSK